MKANRRVIVLEEAKNGSFKCIDDASGKVFGSGASLPDAFQVTMEFLCLQGFAGDGVLLMKPWRAKPFVENVLVKHNFNEGKNLWKS